MKSWVVVNFDAGRISPNLANKVIHDLMAACRSLGTYFFLFDHINANYIHQEWVRGL
jgi:hypothetical protein